MAATLQAPDALSPGMRSLFPFLLGILGMVLIVGPLSVQAHGPHYGCQDFVTRWACANRGNSCCGDGLCHSSCCGSLGAQCSSSSHCCNGICTGGRCITQAPPGTGGSGTGSGGTSPGTGGTPPATGGGGTTCTKYTGQACGTKGGECHTTSDCSPITVGTSCTPPSDPGEYEYAQSVPGTYAQGLCPGQSETRCCEPTCTPACDFSSVDECTATVSDSCVGSCTRELPSHCGSGCDSECQYPSSCAMTAPDLCDGTSCSRAMPEGCDPTPCSNPGEVFECPAGESCCSNGYCIEGTCPDSDYTCGTREDGSVCGETRCDGNDLIVGTCTEFLCKDERYTCPGGCAYGDCLTIDSEEECQAAGGTYGGPGVCCGDGTVQSGEQCDIGIWQSQVTCASLGYRSGALSCTDTCQYDTSACTGASGTCGNSILEPSEQCDLWNLGNVDDCQDFGMEGGLLFCSPSCDYDTSLCGTVIGGFCGDGLIEAGEQCEVSGSIPPLLCQDFGFSGGIMLCDGACQYDTSLCINDSTPICGDGILQIGEQCEQGLPIQHIGCSDFGRFNTGTLGCSSDCLLDTSLCTIEEEDDCGNGFLQEGEECDLLDWGTLNVCGDLGLGPGTLVCDQNCRFDTGGCQGPAGDCGNSVLNPGELCDGLDFGSYDACEDWGYEAGRLACASDCEIDVTECGEFLDICLEDKDCVSGTCGEDGFCAPEACTGAACADAIACDADSPCTVGECVDGFCEGPNCLDGIKNGDESDVDCGLDCPVRCQAGKTCRYHADCVSGICQDDRTCADNERGVVLDPTLQPGDSRAEGSSWVGGFLKTLLWLLILALLIGGGYYGYERWKSSKDGPVNIPSDKRQAPKQQEPPPGRPRIQLSMGEQEALRRYRNKSRRDQDSQMFKLFDVEGHHRKYETIAKESIEQGKTRGPKKKKISKNDIAQTFSEFDKGNTGIQEDDNITKLEKRVERVHGEVKEQVSKKKKKGSKSTSKKK